MDENEKHEKIGRGICVITWLLYALKIIAAASLVSLVILYFSGKPLWLAPIAGILFFAVYYFVRHFFIGLLLKFLGWCNKK